MPERFTETLRAGSEAGWSHAVQHRFVNELFAGACLLYTSDAADE